ncbi:MAG: type II toxin-antitoxin system VapC family toxin [Thermoleophilaceae bacterium]|nr:type II toxin-antitoxin system VapC family toxin [Thermoleophilaceae bacterium]
MAGVIIADASVLIAHLDARDPHHDGAVALLLEAAERPLGASPITLAEVLVGPARAHRLEGARGALREFGVREVPFSPDAAVRLAALRAETRLKLPDCCVLLAADEADADAIMAFDTRLREAARALGRVAL